MTSYYSLLNKIEAFCDAHLQIKKYAGEFREQMPNFCTLDEKYPVVFVAPNGSLNTLNQKEFTLDIYCVDVIQKDRANLNVILSDTELILNDLYLYFSDGDDWTIDVLSAPSLQPVNNFDLDYVAGWFMTITFQVDGYCVEAIPMEPIIPEGGECENASVQNSDASYSQLVASGGSLTLPDITIKVLDENDNILSSGTYPSVQDQVITVDCPDCTDAIINIKKEGDGTIASLTLACGSSTDYYVEDNEISVNGTLITAIDATDPLDVILKDQNNNTIVPTSVQHDGNQHHLNIKIDTSAIVPSSATLMKTGQTISYATGDDGDLEAGRASTFFILPNNNPFGNTDRFTSINGNQTFTHNVMIDWSTYNGVNVLGYYMLPQGPTNWNTAIANALTFNAGGGFNTGWRVANTNEYMNICNYAFNISLNWSPLSISNAAYFHTSTTYASGTSNAMKFFYTGQLFADPKANNALAIYCRTFGVSGTTLT